MRRGRTFAAIGVLMVVAIATGALWLGLEESPPPAPTPLPAEGQRPALWLLSVGVSRYAAPGIDLRFAEADARAVAEMLRAQKGRGLYSEVHARVLVNEEVTRESILNGIGGFLGQAGPDDVAVLFLAGHGVREPITGSYYFLPNPATADNAITRGVRMSDLNEMIRILHSNVGRVVLMLDTCHAGALRVASRAAVSDVNLAAQIATAEGLYVLAATKPGEESREQGGLGHGVFTYALLEGLGGAADPDGDDLVTVSDLFGWVARRVPRLTAGAQHPYHRIEGTDLTFAVIGEGKRPAALHELQDLPAAISPVRNTEADPNAVAVMKFRNVREDGAHAWIGPALLSALNTELTKVPVLQVHAPELIARRRALRVDNLDAAQSIGIGKLISGTYVVIGKMLQVDAQIVDTATGVYQASVSVRGPLDEFFDLEKELALRLLRHLSVPTPEADERIRRQRNNDVDAYRLLLEAEGVTQEVLAEEPAAPILSPTAPPQSSPHSFLRGLLLADSAYAQDGPADIAARVHALLAAYEQAYEAKDLDRIAALYVNFTDRQHRATAAYLSNAVDLQVRIEDVDIERDDEALIVSYLRRDTFTDGKSGREVEVEVRLVKTLVERDGKWKMVAGQ